MATEKKTTKRKDRQKEVRQQAAADWIRINYLEGGNLRLDSVRQQIQILSPLKAEEIASRIALSSSVSGGEIPLNAEEIGGQSRLVWRDLTDRDINDMVCGCCGETGASVTSREVLTVLHSSLLPEVHPLREYVLSQAVYDPEKEPSWIAEMAAQVTLTDPDKTDLWRRCFAKWFIAMVASWLRDDAVNQQVLVLIGRQGIYKTTWLEHLIPPVLRRYTCKMANTQWTKDDRLRLAEFGLINLDEIDAMNNREVNSLKSLITATDINERVAYGYTKERRLRLASFCASGNKREFLSDITGNRRWLPFEVESIASPFTHTLFPLGRMYAQARYLIEMGFPYWFEQDEISQMAQHQDEFRAQDNEEQLLSVLFDVPAEGMGEFLTTAQISDVLVREGSIKRPMPLNRLGMLLNKQGFKCVRRGPQKVRGWLVYQRSSEEVKTKKRYYATISDDGTGTSWTS